MQNVRESVSEQSPVAAIVILMTGLLFAALNGAVMKLLTDSMPAWMIVWARYSAYLAVMLPIALWYHGLKTFVPPRPGLQIIRVLLLLLGTVCFVYGVAKIPYADAIAIIYVYPFVLTAISPFFLGERVPRIAWLGVIFGFAGVVIVMRPQFDASSAYHALTLVTGIALGFHLMLTRMLSRAVSPVITSTFTAAVTVGLTTLSLPFVWQPVSMRELGLIAFMGAISALSQWLVIVAFSKAPAPILAPFSYAEIPAAVMIGLVVFAEWPDAVAWGGIAVIIVSGMVVARAPAIATAIERKRRPGL